MLKGRLTYTIPITITLAFSALYEIIEWAAAEMVGGELGTAYLGTQGDVWDAQKDMALAGLGAILAMIAAFIVHRRQGKL
jgi:putative membrane protein